MEVPIYIHKPLFSLSFLFFLENIKNCKVCELYNEKKLIKHRIIFTPHNFDKINLNNFLDWCDECLQAGSIIFCAKNLSRISKISKFHLIYYPISVLDFEKIINNYSGKNNLEFSSLFLGDNILQNFKNNQIITLTDTEQEILKMLFEKQKIKRANLEKQVLHFVDGTESKSLDSHLVRIRKKIFQIGGGFTISSVDSMYIVLQKN